MDLKDYIATVAPLNEPAMEKARELLENKVMLRTVVAAAVVGEKVASATVGMNV